MAKNTENKNNADKNGAIAKFQKHIATKPPLKNHHIGRTIAITILPDAVVFATHSRGLLRSRLLDATRVAMPLDLSGSDERQAFINNVVGVYLKKFRRPMTKFVMGTGSVDGAFRVINLPRMPRKDLAGAIYWEANKQIPFKLDRSYYGYRILPHTGNANDDDRRISVAFTAVQRPGIDENLHYLHTAGVNISAVYSDLEAVGFLLLGLKDFREDEVYILVRCGSTRTEITFYQGHRLTFVHTVSLGIPPQDNDDIGGTLIERYHDTLLSELQNSLDYYAGLHPSATPRTIYMYGKVSCRTNTLNDLSERSGFRFKNISDDLDIKIKRKTGTKGDDILRALGTISLALVDYRLLNFLPPDLKEMQAEKRFYRLAMPAMALLVVCLLGMWMSWKATADIEKSRLTSLESQIASFQNSISYTIYQQIKRQIANDQEMLKLLESNPTFLNLNLKELTLLTPWKIKLLQYELNNERGLLDLTLTGQVYSNDPPPEVVLAEYIAGLEKSPFYNLVTLKRHSKKYENGRFIVDFQIDMKAVI